jgi:hypothetical protein
MLANKVVKVINANAEKPIQNALDEHLPKDSESVRNLPFYNSTVEAIRYQRDNYLVGTVYATRKEDQRQRVAAQRTRLFTPPTGRFIGAGSPRMPRDATALGYIQIVNLGSWFIPSSTIKESLMPIFLSLPSGALRETITNAVSNSIPLAQPPLDRAVKNAIMGFIDSPQMRQMVKNRTEKILKVKDNSGGNNYNKNNTTTTEED